MSRKRPIPQNKLADYISWSGFAVGCASIVPVFTQNQTSTTFFVVIGLGVLIFAFGLSVRLSEVVYASVSSIFDSGLTRIGRCLDHHVDQVYEIGRRYFGSEITDVTKIKEIQAKYKDGLQVAIRKDKNGSEVVAGYFFLFPINKSCVEKILAFTFDVANIQPDEIATRPRYGYAMYIGGIAADGILARRELLGAIKMANAQVALTKTRTAYARAATKRGLDLLKRNGFSPVHPAADSIDCFFMKKMS